MPFKLVCFLVCLVFVFCGVSGWVSLRSGPSVISVPVTGCGVRGEVSVDIVSLSFLQISTWFFYL